jgi:hypothetical protein
VTQVVEHFPSKHEVLSSTPSAKNQQKLDVAFYKIRQTFKTFFALYIEHISLVK